MKKRNLDIIEFLLWGGIIILLNVVVSQYFFRIDLTADKRYTISSSSKEALKTLNDKVYIEIYLTGELPSEYKRFEKSIRETLDEFRVYAGEKVQYKFFDPNSEEDQQKKSRIYEYLSKKGIKPTTITTEDGVKYVFPAALLVYKEKELPIILLNGNRVEGEGEMVNQSIEGLEYEFISGIKQLSLKNKKSVAIVQGHDEYDPPSLAEISKSIAQFYNIYGIDLKNVKELDNYDALIIARPEKRFTDEEKYILDQYIMKGGNVLFFMDALRVNLDSVGDAGTLAIPYDNNLDDLIFKYGLRINADLIQDMQATQIPLYIGETGDQPQVTMMPWRYFPLLNNFGDHPSVKNIDVIYSKFVSTIDTVKAPGIKRIPLVFTSRYCKVYSGAVRVDFNEAKKQADPKTFDKGPFAIAYLLEGNFQSLYKNRPLPIKDPGFKAEGNKGQVFVCSDADIIRNEIAQRKTGFQPVKLPPGNRDLVTNVIDYMLDEGGLINVRAKEIALRPLDKEEVKDDRLMWQVINLIIPVILILAFGLARYYWRKRKYENYPAK